MSIKCWPTSQQPRLKLLAHGARSLTDAELLALFINTGIPGKSAVDIAHDLLRHYGSLKALLNAPLAAWQQQAGLGPAKYVRLQAALEISRRYLYSQVEQQSLGNISDLQLHEFLKTQFAQYQHEMFACLYLNIKHEVLCFEELFSGTISYTEIYPREVVKRALKHNASAVIFAHNHPSGSAKPSRADVAITQRLQQALATIDVQVLDHLIITERELSSMINLGLLRYHSR